MKDDVEIAGEVETLERVVENAEIEPEGRRLAAGSEAAAADENAGSGIAAGDQNRLIARFPETAEKRFSIREDAAGPFPGAAISAADQGGLPSFPEKMSDDFAGQRRFPLSSKGEIADRKDRKRGAGRRFPPPAVPGGLAGADGAGNQGIDPEKDSHCGRIYHRTAAMPISSPDRRLSSSGVPF